jgi:aspartokinase
MPRSDLKLATGVSISSAARDEINFDLSIQDALARDYVNISALARMLLPRIEERTGRKVNRESVVTSLKRLRGVYSPASQEIRQVIAESVVNVRTHVSKMSIEKTKKVLQTVSEMLSSHQENFLQVSESLSAITLIFDQRLHRKVKEELRHADFLEEGDDYAAIIVQSPPAIITTPGCIISFYNQLARRHVNIEDTVSCHTDTIVVVRMKDVGRAFDALTDLITEERKRLDQSSD